MEKRKNDSERKRAKTAFYAGVFLCFFFACPMLIGSKRTSFSQIDGKLNPNVAGIYELAELPNIGQARANAIAEYRQNNKFKNVSDIEAVKGIGEKTVRKLEPYLKFEDAD